MAPQNPSLGDRAEHDTNGVVPVAVIFTILEVTCVALRFWARKIGKVSFGVDDILMIPSLILCLAVNALCLCDIDYGGVGYHQDYLAATDPAKLVVWAKYALIIPQVYIAAVVLPKLAILIMYLRIFTQRRDRVVCWVLAVLIVANYVGTMIAGFLICVPLEYLWDRTIPGGHCININAWYRWSSLMNIFTDFVMLILPLPVVWALKTSKKVKIGLTITFATGSIGLISSILRFHVFFAHNASADVTWTASKLMPLTIVETGIYLIAACLLTFRPLAIYIWRKTPLSIIHLGSAPHNPRGAEGAHSEDSKNRLRTSKTMGFTRLGKDERTNISSISENGEG